MSERVYKTLLPVAAAAAVLTEAPVSISVVVA